MSIFRSITKLGDELSSFPNGTLRGLTVNLIQNGFADISVKSTGIDAKRIKQFTFLQPSYLVRYFSRA